MNKLNKKGASLGALIMIFIGVIVAIALLVGMTSDVGNMRNIYTITNGSITTAAAVNGTVTLTGRENTTAITVTNMTADHSANYTVTTRNAGGSLAILLKTTDAAGAVGSNGTAMNVTYSYKPQGYNDSAASRAIVGLILIMAALAIAVFVIPGFREFVENKFGFQ
jgi:hypothetical protein